jgi:hypothetical protein
MRSVSSTGAQAPICAAVGKTPISAVAAPMISIVSARLRLRPIRSPIWPNASPPIGRMRNPTANVANAKSVPTNELSLGKKTRWNTRPAAVAYRKKSYHSTVVPSRLAATTTRSRRRRWASGSL